MNTRRSNGAFVALAAAAMWTSAGGAAAQSRSTPPDWVHPPVIDDYKAYPDFALMLGIEGLAMATCRIWEEGPPRDCAVSASPAGLGFEAAAMDFLADSVMRPATEDGQVVGGVQVAIPISMRIADTHRDVPYTGAPPGEQKLALAMTIARAAVNGQPFPLDDLPDDRRERVLAMIEEAKQADLEAITRTMALGLARSYDHDRLETIASTIPDPETMSLEDLREWFAVLGYMGVLKPADPDSFDPAWHEHALVMERFIASVRAQYCAAYGCSAERPYAPYLSSLQTEPQ